MNRSRIIDDLQRGLDAVERRQAERRWEQVRFLRVAMLRDTAPLDRLRAEAQAADAHVAHLPVDAMQVASVHR